MHPPPPCGAGAGTLRALLPATVLSGPPPSGDRWAPATTSRTRRLGRGSTTGRRESSASSAASTAADLKESVIPGSRRNLAVDGSIDVRSGGPFIQKAANLRSQSPVAPSSRSRSRSSAWPLWRAYSSIMWRYTQRTLIWALRWEWKNVASRSRPAAAWRAKSDLALVDGEVVLGVGGVDVVELPVGVSLAGVEIADVLSRDAAAEPAALYLGHVTDEPEQGKVRRRGGALPELRGGQAAAFAQAASGGEAQATPPASAGPWRRRARSR